MLSILILQKVNGGEKVKKLAILCVLVMAISLVPAFAADTNNTTATKENLKHQYKHNNTQKDCTDGDNDGLKVNAKHQYKYKKGIKKTTSTTKKSGTKAKNQSKHKYGLKNTKKTSQNQWLKSTNTRILKRVKIKPL